jgi:hypothetical protein
LSSILSGAQLEYAVSVLGTFSNTWDVMADAIADLKLDEEKTFAALKPIEVYIAETAELQRGPRADRRADMQAMLEARRKLLDTMQTVLNEAQFDGFQRAVPGGRGRGQGFAGMFERWDENGDGVLQRSEVPARMERMFDRLDADGNGVLDEEELEAADRPGRGGRTGDRPGRGPDAP